MKKRVRRAVGLTLIALVAVWAVLAAGPREGDSAGAVRARGTPEATDPGPLGSAAPASAATAHAPAPKPPEEDPPMSPAAQPPALPSCAVADEPAPRAALDEWRYTVLDTRFMLPADYAPPDLVDLATALDGVAPYVAPKGARLRAVLLTDLVLLVRAAEAAGAPLEIQSAYRSYEYQRTVFDGWVARDGYDAALRSSARAGHSEHQLGTVFDVKSRGGPPPWDLDDWASTPEGAWMAANAWRFGFVMSYPPGKENVTCYVYEPWHYRYLGRELAAAVHASGLAPREYLWNLLVAADDD